MLDANAAKSTKGMIMATKSSAEGAHDPRACGARGVDILTRAVKNTAPAEPGSICRTDPVNPKVKGIERLAGIPSDFYRILILGGADPGLNVTELRYITYRHFGEADLCIGGKPKIALEGEAHLA